MCLGEQGAKGQWHWCHIHFASVRELIRLHTARKVKGEWIGEWNQNEKQHILHIYSCCKSDGVKNRPHSLPFQSKNGLRTQSRDFSILVSHLWNGLIAEPWVKCLNTREAQSHISLSIPFQFLAVCSWVFFQPEIVSSSPYWILFNGDFQGLKSLHSKNCLCSWKWDTEIQNDQFTMSWYLTNFVLWKQV